MYVTVLYCTVYKISIFQYLLHHGSFIEKKLTGIWKFELLKALFTLREDLKSYGNFSGSQPKASNLSFLPAIYQKEINFNYHKLILLFMPVCLDRTVLPEIMKILLCYLWVLLLLPCYTPEWQRHPFRPARGLSDGKGLAADRGVLRGGVGINLAR